MLHCAPSPGDPAGTGGRVPENAPTSLGGAVDPDRGDADPRGDRLLVRVRASARALVGALVPVDFQWKATAIAWGTTVGVGMALALIFAVLATR